LTTVTSAPAGPTGGAPAGFVLFCGWGSLVSDATVALLMMSAPLPVYVGFNWTTMSKVCVPPTASVGSTGQLTICPAAVQPAADATNVVCEGSGSVVRTFTAVDGPLFVTCNV
jgi:hypothetical protein